jgi:hypothetical protein
MAGAGVQGRCNPVDEGWAKFWRVLQPGSWLEVIRPAGHMQFLDVRGAAAWALDLLCGSGDIDRKRARHLALGPSIAWLQAAFRPEQARCGRMHMAWSEMKQPDCSSATRDARVADCCRHFH